MPPQTHVHLKEKPWELPLSWLSVLTLAMICLKVSEGRIFTIREDNVQWPLLQELFSCQGGHVIMVIPDAAFSAVRFCSYTTRRTQYDRPISNKYHSCIIYSPKDSLDRAIDAHFHPSLYSNPIDFAGHPYNIATLPRTLWWRPMFQRSLSLPTVISS